MRSSHSFSVLVTLSSESADMLGVAREVVTPQDVAAACALAVSDSVRRGVGPMVPVVVSVAAVDQDLDGRSEVSVP